MSQVINTNVASLNSQRNLSQSGTALSTSLQRLSSGLRINSAKDDAAGLAISERMTSQIKGLDQARRNTNDGISLSQTAEGALGEIGNNIQRIRELALQSANATNSSSDRDSLNAEAQQMLQEIQRVATTTQFNGLNLIDGSFSNAQFQVGANANQTINVTMTGATTNVLGAYQATSTAVNSTALDGAGLKINGVTIGASAATSAAGVTAGSATAKATAINAKSAETGVTAMGTTTVSGTSAPIARSGLGNGVLRINGIEIGSVGASADAVAQGQNAAAEINKLTSQHGVTATVNRSNGTLSLTSSEGRDIKLTTSTDNDAGAVAVFNATGLDVTTGVDPTGNEVGVLTFATAAMGNAETIAVGGRTYEFVTTAGTATAGNVEVLRGADHTASGTNFTAAVNAEFTAGRTSLQAAGTTTVTLTDTKVGVVGNAVVETAANVSAAAFTGGVASVGFAGGKTTTGTLTLSSAENFSFTGSVSNMLTATGLTSSSASLSQLANLAIDTVAGANNAISILDGALQQINSQRGALGAYQNRFASTITNLQTTSENLSASRSRIRDADFAAETANLSRNQVLQQAGTAMLAQANALPNQVLSLLRG